MGDYGTVLHSDGETWTPVYAGIADDLFAVWARTSDDVWAVGGSGWPVDPVGVIVHFDGQAWTVAKRGTMRLECVWGSGPTDIWAGGTNGEFQHYDGTAWTSCSGVTTETIVDISGTSSQQAWAVGSTGLLLSWDGTTWTKIPTGTGAGFSSVLAFSPTLVWAAGGNGLFFTWNGTAWNGFNIGQDYTVLGLWGEAAQAWAVGPSGSVLYFDGVTPAVKASGTTGLLRDVGGADADHVWAVGFNGIILRHRR